MKAIVKKTGECVELTDEIQYTRWTVECHKTTDGRIIPTRDLEFETPINWEQRRYEIAKELLAAFMSNSSSNVYSGTIEKQAADAVLYADALIEQLKTIQQ